MTHHTHKMLSRQILKIRFSVEEQDRNNRISNENNALNSRIKNYQEELIAKEKDIERLRESRKKMEIELDHEKANTKVRSYVLTFYDSLHLVCSKRGEIKRNTKR